MGLRKGMTNNPYGRPKGSHNKVNNEIRAKVLELLENNFNGIQADIESLEPKDRLKFLTDLLPYLLPKLQSTTITDSQEPQKVIIEGISTEELMQGLEED